ncbi:MAG: amino acid ABC transporter permease [Lachnospiraceae bacterium]|nr:amino acid ABC transporter permease [Lachnospiraceae bacterium]
MTGFFSNIARILKDYWYIYFVSGVGYTLLLSVITVFFGAILGLLVYFVRRSSFKPLQWLGTAFVAVIRGTPMLLQLYVGYFLVPKILPFQVSEFSSVAVALALNSAAYVSEIFRSGIEAVDKGQMEAARTLGLSYSQAMKKVVFPQAVKNILPALGNEFIMIVKDTSLASTFFIGDIMTSYLKVKGITYLPFENLTIVAIIYFVLTFILTRLLGMFEKRLKRND